jgi:hypothetical protein
VPAGDGPAGPGLADLNAIRRCDALLDLAARRRLDPALTRRDPAFAVLRMLAADVDGTAPSRSAGPQRPPAPARRPRRVSVAAIAASALATLMLAVTAAAATSLLAVGMLARLGWPRRGAQ